MDDNNILLAIRTLSYQGGKILGSKWLTLVDGIRQALARSGFEQAESSDELLIFLFPNPFLAITSLIEGLESVKVKHGWQEGQEGALPVQTVIHLIEKDDSLPQIRYSTSNAWDMLQQETIYITPPLMRNWETLTADRDLPAHRFEDDGSSFYQMVITDKNSIRKAELFSYRSLPVHGKHKECFYCGMTGHNPATCPSKFISMDMQGLNQVGYLSFADLNAIYKKIFPDYSTCLKKIVTGINPAQLRQDKELLVFVSFLDLTRIYQLRFLAHIAFSPNPKWDAQESGERLNIDSRNLHLGLDCLRVGQYAKAETMLSGESRKKGGKHFYAAVGLAFWALEQGRTKDMGHYLEKAKNIAFQEKERIYSQLLLSRYYELHDDYWKAKESVNNAIKISSYVVECQYRKIQLNVRYGFDEGNLKRLRVLMAGQKEIFITALLDPLLLPVQGLVNDLAIEQIQLQRKEAARNMAMAEAESVELGYWFDENDPLIKEIGRVLNELRKQYKRETYYDVLDVLERAKGHAYSCQRIRKTKLEEFGTRKANLENRSVQFQNFWQDYQYKGLFKAFLRSLLSVTNFLRETRALIAKQEGREYRAAVNLLDQVEKSFTAMHQMQDRMIGVRLMLNGMKTFLINMVLSELSLLTAVFLVFTVLPMQLENASYVSLYKILVDPVMQKKSMLISGFFLAPLLAIVLTTWKLRNES